MEEFVCAGGDEVFLGQKLDGVGEGVKKANLVLQANDIIYVQPRNRYPEKFMTTVTPYLSLVTFILLIAQSVK